MNALHGAPLATNPVAKEQPWHRTLAALLAAGYSKSAAANTLGKSIAAVMDASKCDWFQRELLLALKTQGESVKSVLANQAMVSLATIIEIRDNTSVKPDTRLKAAMHLLEQNIGKPVDRHADVTEEFATDPVAEATRLEKEINRMKGISLDATGRN